MLRRRRIVIIITALLSIFLCVSLVLVRNHDASMPPQELMVNNRWHAVGPSPIQTSYTQVSGRILSIAKNGPDIYVGTADGGLWVSRNQGTTWSPMSDYEPSLAIQSIAIDSKNPNVIYLGTGEPHSFLGTYSYPNAFYGAGILVTKDGGAHWTQEGTSAFHSHSVTSMLIDAKQSTKLFAAAGESIYESDDSGHNWKAVYTGDQYHRVMQIVQDPDNPMQLFAGVEGTGLIESLDGGQTWRAVHAMPNSSGISGISISYIPHHSNVLYAFVSNYKTVNNSGLYVSKDDGKNWSKLSGLQAIVSDAETAVTAHVEVAVDPMNPQHLFVGGYYIGESRDGGHSWTAVRGPHMDDQSIVFDTNGTAYFGTDGGIWADEGGVVTDLNTNLDITQFYAGLTISPSGRLFGGTQDNGSVAYLPTIKQWLQLNGGDGGYTAQDSRNSQILYSETDFPWHLYKSIDGGTTWTDISPQFSLRQFELGLMPIEVSQENPKHMLLGADRVYQSDNAGSTWTPISPAWENGNSLDNSVTYVTESTKGTHAIYAGTHTGQVFKTTDDGKSWTELTPTGAQYTEPTMVVSVVLNPSHPNEAYAVFGSNGSMPFSPPSGEHVFYTKDGGTTWTKMDGNLPHTLISSAVLYKDSVVVGTSQGVYASAWGRTTWESVGTRLPNTPVTNIVSTSTNLYVSTVGRGVWSMGLSK